MEHLANFGTSIPTSMLGTFQTYAPLLVANKSAITSTTLSTHTYGPHPRQVLDVYQPPPESAPPNGPPRILVSLYGGGFIRGDRVLSSPPSLQSLVYTNLGHFFAQHLNIVTVIPDYRRVAADGEDARFPSGGEDVAAVLEWVQSEYGAEGASRPDVFLMGHSAGGVHVSTFLLDARFATQRAALTRPDSANEARIRLCGVILLSTPLDFRHSPVERAETLGTYYGTTMAKDDPLGLLERLDGTQHGIIPRVIVLRGTLDPDDEIVQPNLTFARTWDARTDLEKLDVTVLEGHNHFSPVLCLGTGLATEEAWGYTLGKWMDEQCTR